MLDINYRRSTFYKVVKMTLRQVFEMSYNEFEAKSRMSARNIFRKVFDKVRVNKAKLRLRQALKKSYKNNQAKLLNCSYAKFPKTLRSKPRQNCWKAAGTIIEKYFGQFRGKNFELLHACFENVLKLLETIILTSIWDKLRKRLSITPRE